MSQQNQELISRILDLHIPVVIMPVDCQESTPIEELMLDQPGSHTNERYIIAYKNDIDSNSKTDDLNKIPGFKSKHNMSKAIHGCSATLNKELIPQLMDDPDILYIEKDAVMYDMCHSKEPIGDEVETKRIQQLQTLWHQTITNTPMTSTDDFSTVHCYVLDSGILPTHAEFTTGQVTLSYNPMTKNNQARDDNGHGTGVASIIGGKTVGIANKVKLYSIKVLDATGSGYTSDIISGLNWVINNKKTPCVINMSLGGSFSSSLNTAVQNCINNGIQVVCAAGNEGVDAGNLSPANVPAAITVSAYDQNKTKPSWGNFGSVLDTFGPGSAIKAAWGDAVSSYFLVSGTSFAAPIITGIICRYLKEKPNAKPSDILGFLYRANIANEIANPGTNSPNLRLVWNSTKINPC